MKKLSAKHFQYAIADIAAALQQQIEADCEGFPSDPKASAKRREQALADFTFFRRTYFPHYCTTPGDSALHTWLDAALPRMAEAREGQHIALAAPRGEAKSTFISLFFVLWCVLTGRKRYILIIADALEQAAILLEAVKAELDGNPRLAMDFPTETGRGRVWNVGTILTAQNVKLQALGAGKRMRGLRHGPHRPDLVILDDLENDENVAKPEQRDKLQDWLQKTVLNLGAADGSMDVVYVGTILHYDSVLARTLEKPTWQAKRFRSIVQWPERLDLWDKWEAILHADGPVAARAFYDLYQDDMERGAIVSWPAGRPLYQLMTKRADSHAAFDSEQQNDPLCGDDAPFNGCITFWVDRRADWLLFGAVDPSLGKLGAGRDPSAILVGGLLRDTMTLDVVEASIRKRHPDRIIEDVIALHSAYHCLNWGVEAVQFQAFFADVLAQRAATRGLAFPVRPIINSTDKQLRIETLQPYFTQGRIRLHTSQQTLIDQLRHFPKADHDDGPDALEMLWRLAVGGFVSLRDAFERVPRQSPWGVRPSEEDDFDSFDTYGGWT
ncbi:phage terminase large subunit [Bilophila wadsworthia]|uniref:phage terminase large subunit n=1 Tax=Bilophila wadsworthia TaxID=35833 RepID=UPI001D743921|nr:phage terminase large subunit [Bilophila wadsworthia]MBS5376683.1 phage terminase large subunit [Bilophila wadsworthia]